MHTGQRVVLEHYRPNLETNEIVELEPIDINPSYDFNFQQFNHLPREHIVLPVSQSYIADKSIVVYYT